MSTLDWMMAAVTVASTIVSIGAVVINLRVDHALRRAARARRMQ